MHAGALSISVPPLVEPWFHEVDYTFLYGAHVVHPSCIRCTVHNSVHLGVLLLPGGVLCIPVSI
jgi:hypothetical protein